MFLFSLLNDRQVWEVFLGLGRGWGSEEFFLARPSQNIYMLLGTSRVIWGDLGAFGVILVILDAESLCGIKRFVRYVNV